MKVLITGATGAVGPRVVQALVNAGHTVRSFSLEAPPASGWPAGVETLSGDITDAQTVRRAAEGMEAIVHLAALLHVVNPPPAWRERYERINVGGTAAVLEAAQAAGAGRVVLFSTIAVYGYSSGQLLTEATPPRPETLYGETKLAAEKLVLQARRSDGQPLGTVLRLGAVYGSRIKGNYQRLVLALAHGQFIGVGAGLNRRTLVYDRDVAAAAVLAVSRPAAAGRLYNVTDGALHPLHTIIEAMCAALGRRPPRWSLPIKPVLWAAGLVEDAARLVGRSAPINRSTIDKYIEDVAVDGSLIQRELGFRPQYDLAAGWDETVREMRTLGLLK